MCMAMSDSRPRPHGVSHADGGHSATRGCAVRLAASVSLAWLVIAPSGLFAADFPKGSASLSYLNSTIIDAGAADETEHVLRLEFEQEIPTYGQLFGTIDGVGLHTDGRVGRRTLGLRNFHLGRFTLDAVAGDSTLTLRLLPTRFANTTIPTLYLRGGQLTAVSDQLTISLFGGQLANLTGLLGTSYVMTSTMTAGLKTTYRPNKRLTVGQGIIATWNEEGAGGTTRTDHNLIWLTENELTLPGDVSIIAEGGMSRARSASPSCVPAPCVPPPPVPERTGYVIKVGPAYQRPEFTAQLNYRRISPTYRFVTEQTQVEQDTEGLFLTSTFSPKEWLTFLATGELFQDNLDRDPAKSRTMTHRALAGITLAPHPFPTAVLRVDLLSRHPLSTMTPRDETSWKLTLDITQSSPVLTPFLRSAIERFSSHEDPTSSFQQYRLSGGARWYPRRMLYLSLELGLDRKHSASGAQTLTQTFSTATINYNVSSNLRTTVSATIQLDNGEPVGGNRIETEWHAGVNWTIKTWFLSADVHWTNSAADSGTVSDVNRLLVQARLTKKFSWGRRIPVVGRSDRPTRGLGAIEGDIYTDANHNGRRDPGETGLGNVRLFLEDGSSTFTDESGHYRFPYVEVGTHTVKLETRKIPATYNILTDQRTSVEVTQRHTTRFDVPLAASGTISGLIFHDHNGNHRQEPGEEGIPDVLVFIEPGHHNAYTDESGAFVIENLTPKQYTVTIDPATFPHLTKSYAPLEVILTLSPGQLSRVTFGLSILDLSY